MMRVGLAVLFLLAALCPAPVAWAAFPEGLVDQSGAAIEPTRFQGRFALMSFGYTACPDVCPTTLQTMASAIDLLGEAGGVVVPVFVTIDPERDRADVLAGYVGLFHPRAVGVTGTPDAIAQLAKTYRVIYRKAPLPGGDPGQYAMDHTATMFLLAPDGRLIARLSHTLDARKLAARLAQALAGER